jgi:hypothetical protein
MHKVYAEHADTHARFPIDIDFEHLGEKVHNEVSPCKIWKRRFQEDNIECLYVKATEVNQTNISPVVRSGLIIPFIEAF